MPARHRSRQRALQVLFQADLRQQDVSEAIGSYYRSLGCEDDSYEATPADPFMEQIARGTSSVVQRIDAKITEKSEHWRLDRMPAVDRNILRMAIYEMGDFGTPAAVVIDEAIELARQFSGEESVSFINGVLDAIHREMQNKSGPKTAVATSGSSGELP